MTTIARKGRRVAVLGGGLTGTLAALELAEAGCSVDLYEREDDCIMQASLVNEGKIHLGFVYAKDLPGRTAKTMLTGALLFEPLLARWIDTSEIACAVSEPFIYALHRESMVGEDQLLHHFQAIEELYGGLKHATGGRYIGTELGRLWRRTAKIEHQTLFDEKYISSSFHTMERALDAHLVADALREAIHASTRINLRLNCEVVSVQEQKRGRFNVCARQDGGHYANGPYDSVVSALWQNRARVDETVGIVVQRGMIHRFKVGLHTPPGVRPSGIRSVTFVLGSFGDTVAFRDRAYASWYPSGLLRQEVGLFPTVPPPDAQTHDLGQVRDDSLKALAQLMPGVEFRREGVGDAWTAAGGYITAWGNSGIDDPVSELHRRHEVGVYSRGQYHSVDTGKYTLAPLFANEVCARVLGRENRAASESSLQRNARQ